MGSPHSCEQSCCKTCTSCKRLQAETGQEEEKKADEDEDDGLGAFEDDSEEQEEDEDGDGEDEEQEEEEEEEAVAEEQQLLVEDKPPGVIMEYDLLYYKNNNSVGVRQKYLGKRQLFSWGGKNCNKDREELMAIGKHVIDKLKKGEKAKS